MSMILYTVGSAVYIAGFLLMCFMTLISMGFANGGPGLLEAIWFTFFWPVAIPVAAVKGALWRRRQ